MHLQVALIPERLEAGETAGMGPGTESETTQKVWESKSKRERYAPVFASDLRSLDIIRFSDFRQCNALVMILQEPARPDGSVRLRIFDGKDECPGRFSQQCTLSLYHTCLAAYAFYLTAILLHHQAYRSRFPAQ